MTICGSQLCACGLVSNSLTVTGSGSVGSPWQVETNMGQIVTSATRPASPINGQGIYETDTQRLLIYDGTNWVIVGGNWPRVKAEQQVAQSIPDNATTTVALTTEIYDTDAIHTGTNGFFTIPATMGGDWTFTASGIWASSAASYRMMSIAVSNNTGAPTQNTPWRHGGQAMLATANVGNSVVGSFRLAAAAIVTLQVHQATGAALNLNTVSFAGHMIRHIPSLV